MLGSVANSIPNWNGNRNSTRSLGSVGSTNSLRSITNFVPEINKSNQNKFNNFYKNENNTSKITRRVGSRNLIGKRNNGANTQGLNNNTKRSSLYKGKNVKPNPYIMINPDENMAFSSNLWLNSLHKYSGRISGITPENIKHRYNKEHEEANAEEQERQKVSFEFGELQQRKRNNKTRAKNNMRTLREKHAKNIEEQEKKIREAKLGVKIANKTRNTFNIDSGLKKKSSWKLWGGKSRK